MKIAVYCSGNKNIDPEFFERTGELGRWMAENGHSLVFGGCDLGLMECVAKAVHDGGGRVIGVIPTKVEERGHVSKYVDIEFRCDNLDDRKALLVQQSDIAIALPGGVGTLDEIFTVVAAATIGYHNKKVILYNMKGFWNSLIAMLDDLAARGVVRGDWHEYIYVAESLEDVTSLLSQP